ncbi:CidA/LrgA family protein [Rummeliibacillus sp. NPDC094406]|uniref:CidA/LrgA family protein n=1 Tax=Rummeliibacillus sp. NPDC094406 TaxID=3364511 RepID=UPI00382E66D5
MQQYGLKFLRIIGQIAVLYLLSEIGKWLMAILHIQFPGSIIGLVILFILLITKTIPESWIASGAEILLAYMTLFFIPVTVGIVNYSELLSWQGMAIIGIILVSTIVSIVASGKTTQMVEIHLEKQKEVQMENLEETCFENIQQKGGA